MLRVAKRGVGGAGYYLAVAAGSGTGIEPAGRWAGAAAAGLGLTGPVDGDALDVVLAGRHPASGAVLSPSHGRVQVAAFDLTFCAPKSVSLLHALGDEDVRRAVQAGHDEAVDTALAYVQDRAAAVRGERSAPRVPAPVAGLVAAGFVHRVSRALDPHLHTHVLVANLGAGPDGRWRALDGRGLYAHRAAADVLYHAQLRSTLTARLGVAWEPARRGRADVAGIGMEARTAFSQRAAAIAADLARTGRHGPAAEALAGHRTRPDRRLDVGADELRDGWRRRAASLGLGPRAFARALDRSARMPAGRGGGRPPDDVDRTARQVADALVRSGRPVARRHAVAMAGWAATVGVPAAMVEEAADRALAVAGSRLGVEPEAWRPGVAEPRLVPARSPADALVDRSLVDRSLVDRSLVDRALVDRALAARGMSRAGARDREGPGRWVDDGGIGLG